MHDWKNDTLLLQSHDGVVKVNLKDGCIQPMISRGSETIFIRINCHVDSKVPSNISLDYVMNWVEALATIDFLGVDIFDPIGEVKKVLE